MSGNCRVAFPNVRVALPDVLEWSGDPAESPGVVGGPYVCPGGLADVREWSGGPFESLGDPPRSLGGQPRGPGMVGTPSRMSLRDGRPFRMCGRPSRLSVNGWESHPDV